MTDLEQKPRPRLFFLVRDVDVTGVSKTGIVAKGIEFPNGQCLMRWIVPPAQSIVLYERMSDLVLIHGHNGSSHVKYLEEIADEHLLQVSALEEDIQSLVGTVSRLSLTAA